MEEDFKNNVNLKYGVIEITCVYEEQEFDRNFT
jgi:hypothetical protein